MESMVHLLPGFVNVSENRPTGTLPAALFGGCRFYEESGTRAHYAEFAVGAVGVSGKTASPPVPDQPVTQDGPALLG